MKKVLFISVNLVILIIFIFYIGSAIEKKDDKPNQIFINEIMASNSSTLKDAYGNYSDWIELYNAGDEEVNLVNYYLTDNWDNLIKWEFPKKVVIPAKGYILVWMSGKNKVDSNNELHTNFSISSNGEGIILVAPDGKTIIDSIEIKRTYNNISYGRLPDGSDNITSFYLEEATPRKANALLQNEVHVPTFSKLGGFYQNEFKLNLNTNENATIYYTLDGSKPTKDSLIYDEEILIKSRKGDPNYLSLIQTSDFEWQGPPDEEVFKGTVVRAMAIMDGKSSDIVTHTYFIDENIEERYHIPVISISTNKENLFDKKTGLFISDNAFEKGEEWEREGHIEFYDETNQIGFSQDIGIRIHGGTTRRAPIKSLRIYARNSKGYFNYPLFKDKEIDSFNSFLLRNGGSGWKNVPFRDAFSQSLIKDSTNVDIQYSQSSIVFINGEYWGIYQIRDRFDEDYIYNHYGTTNIDMLSDSGDSIDYGSNEDYLKLLKLLGADLNYGKNYEYVKEKLDVDNFTDYHIAQIYYMNIDQPGKNVRFWRTREAFESSYEQTDGRWRMMLFDTDMGFLYAPFSNYDRNGLVFSTGLDHHGATKINPKSEWPTFSPNTMNATYPLRALLKSDEFRVNFINRFADLLNTAFDEEVVLTRLEEMEQEVHPYMAEHINRWGLPYSVDKWENDIDEMEAFAHYRPIFMRDHILEYFDLSGTSKVTINTDKTQGYITINSIDIIEKTPNINDPSSWTGTYFNDNPINITANAYKGYKFIRWESNDTDINGSVESTISIKLKKDITLNAVYEVGESIPVENTDDNLNVKDHLPLILGITIPFATLTIFLLGYVLVQKHLNK